jgi:hypothetical protein
MAQTNGPQTATNWGESVQGVQMAITMTNSVVEAGPEIPLVAVIKNSSTNKVKFYETGMPGDFYVALTGSAGERYDIIQLPITTHMQNLRAIYPGEQNVRTLPVSFGKNIRPGDYTLQAARGFYVGDGDDGWIQLESNLLKVQVK